MLVVYVWYFAVVFGQIRSVEVREIAYRPLMVVTVAVLVALVVVAHLLVALANPRDAEKSDDRDREINRFGEYVGGYVLGTGAFFALALAMIEVDYFWISNAILVAMVTSELVTGGTKIVLYRRGI